MGMGGLTVENRTDRVSLYGRLDLTRGKRGRVHARELGALLNRPLGRRHLVRQVPPKQT
jgi:hypothetical protein